MLHHAITLELNADSAECCPARGLRQVLAVGTYQLDEASQQRHGRLYIYQLQLQGPNTPGLQGPLTPSKGIDTHAAHDSQCSNPAASGQGQLQLQQACSLDMPGIFDLKWQPEMPLDSMAGRAHLGAALADGSLRLHHVQLQDAEDAGNGIQLQEVAHCQAVQAGSMALSLDWQPAGSLIAVSGSAGNAAVVQVCEDRLQPVVEWQAHDLEVWCAAFSKTQPSVVYTGSDDSCFKAWDLRAQCTAVQAQFPNDDAGEVCEAGQPPSCLHSNRKVHGAGVCTISPHPLQTHILATGSYDEHVRLWDIRMPSKPVLVTEVSTGGGNWRLRWHPTRQDLLLAACMYNGFTLLQTQPDFSSIHVLEHYEGHQSIAYGVDWFWPGWAQDSLHVSKSDEVELGDALHPIASCSFYDRLLHVWAPSVTL